MINYSNKFYSANQFSLPEYQILYFKEKNHLKGDVVNYVHRIASTNNLPK